MLKPKVRFLKAKTEVIKEQKREEDGKEWETTEGTPKSEQKEEKDLSMPEQILTLQAMDDAMPEQLGIFWMYCSPRRAHAGADFFSLKWLQLVEKASTGAGERYEKQRQRETGVY